MNDCDERNLPFTRYFVLLQRIYEAACRVEAEYPDAHIASVAARKLIAAIECELAGDMMAEPLRRQNRPH